VKRVPAFGGKPVSIHGYVDAHLADDMIGHCSLIRMLMDFNRALIIGKAKGKTKLNPGISARKRRRWKAPYI